MRESSIPIGAVSEMEKRKKLSGTRRNQIAHSQSWHCAGPCGKMLSWMFEIDHIVALCNGGLDTQENMQALCCNCHGEKTYRDCHPERKQPEFMSTVQHEGGEKPKRKRKRKSSPNEIIVEEKTDDEDVLVLSRFFVPPAEVQVQKRKRVHTMDGQKTLRVVLVL